MRTKNKIMYLGLASMMVAGLAGCNSRPKMTGTVVNIDGDLVQKIDMYNETNRNCQKLEDASPQKIVECSEENLDYGVTLNSGDLVMQVKDEAGTLYSLIIRDGSTNLDLSCDLPSISDMARIRYQAISMKNVRFPKPSFNEFNVGFVEYCYLDFFEDEE